MNVLAPCLRLLLAAALIILLPLMVAGGELGAIWLVPALIAVTTMSCWLQAFRTWTEVLACTVSNALMLAVVWLAGWLAFALLRLG